MNKEQGAINNRQLKVNTNHQGFTLMEILMVIAIMGILITIISGAFFELNKNQALDKAVRQVGAVIAQARAETLSSKNDTNYGVHFETDKVVLFSGPTYSVGAVGNVSVAFNNLVSIYSISLLGGGDDVVFDRLTGATNQPGTINFYLNSETGKTKSLSISGTGVIEVN